MKDRCEDEIALKWPARQAAGRPKKTAAPAPPRIPRITRLMALAIKFQEMIDRGEVKDYAGLARLGCVTRARVTQIMNLLNLAPQLLDNIGLAPSQVGVAAVSESQIRRITSLVHWKDQIDAWEQLGGDPRCPVSVVSRRGGILGHGAPNRELRRERSARVWECECEE